MVLAISEARCGIGDVKIDAVCRRCILAGERIRARWLERALAIGEWRKRDVPIGVGVAAIGGIWAS